MSSSWSGGGRHPTAELYRQIEQANEQASELQIERNALSEVLARMRVDEQALLASVADVEKQCQTLESKLDQEARRDAQVSEETAALEAQAAAVRTQIAAQARRLDALTKEAVSLERALQESQREVSIACKCLSGAIEDVIRLDYKLRFSTDMDARTPPAARM